MATEYKTFHRLDFNTRYFIRVRVKWGDKVGPWLDPPLDYTTMSEDTIPAPVNVALDFDTKEKSRHVRYRCIVSWDEVTLPSCDPTDVDYYVVQLWRWDPNTNSFMDTEPVRKKKVEAKDEDAGNRAKAVFFPVRRKGWYKARVRAIVNHKRGLWSQFSPAGSPSDTTAPPTPINVTIYDKSTNRVVVDWDAPSDPDDPDLINEDIAYFQVQLHTNQSFTNLYRFDRYHHATKKSFRVKDGDLGGTYYARVRSVDASGNKSQWVPATIIGNSDPNATPDGVTIGGGGGVVATFFKPGKLVAKHYAGKRWTNTTGRTLTFKRARLTIGAHDPATHPNDGCPTGSAVRVQLRRWLADLSSHDPIFSTDDRLKVDANTHKDVNSATSFQITQLQPDESITPDFRSVGSNFPGEDAELTVFME